MQHLLPEEMTPDSSASAERARQPHAGFFDELRAALMHLGDLDRLLDRVLSGVRAELRVDRATYGLMAPDGHSITIVRQSAEHPGSVLGDYEASDFFDPDTVRAILEATTTTVADVSRDPRTSSHLQQFRALNVAAFIVEPIVAEDGMRTLLSVSCQRPRAWDADDVQLLRDVAAYLYPAVERARAERALRISEMEFRSIFELSAAGAAQTNPDTGRFTRVNRKLCEMTGYSEEELLEKTFSDITHEEDRRRDVEAVRRVLAAQASGWEHEKRYLRKDGTIRWVLVTGTVLPAVGGKPPAAVAIIQDIHARKQAEEALRTLNEELLDANRRKDEFLAMLAHELRNPLAPVRTALGILQGGTPDAEIVARCHEVIGRQVSQMARLLDDLLDVSRLSRGKLTLRRGPVFLHEILDAAIETSRPVIHQHGHHLAVQLPDEAMLLDADATRLTQVFGNLLNNAAHYTEPGGHIDVTVRRESSQVLIEVRDNGIGIPGEMMDRVFDLFTQASSADRSTGGLGIGLALARRLVEMHGGNIQAASAGAGCGSTFTVSLPLVTTRAAVTATEAEGAARPPLARRVLVADDNADAADMMGMLLETLGCVVKVTYDGTSALREAEAFAPEIVLLDIGMPDIAGYEVCRRIRGLRSGGAMTVVAVTGWGQEEDRRRSAMAGFDQHLVKPVSPDALVQLVRDSPKRTM